MSFQQAGGSRSPWTGTARFSGAGARRFFRLFTPGATLQRRIRIVDSCGDVFSDPGATPGASTTRLGRFAPSLVAGPSPHRGVWPAHARLRSVRVEGCPERARRASRGAPLDAGLLLY